MISNKIKKLVQKTSKALQEDRVIVVPTDTVYGLITNAFSNKAVDKVFRVKQRDKNKPAPVLVRDLKMAKELAFVPKEKEKILKKFWPGKLTAVLKSKKRDFPKGILNKEGKIGLRVPNYRFLNLILEEINFPLIGTSANISGKGSILKFKEVVIQFKDQEYQPDVVINKGELKKSLSSTVVDLTNFKILREGAIPSSRIMKFQNE